MTDWFDDLNGVTQTAGGKATAAPQQRDWFSDINGASPQKAAKASPAPAEQGWVDWATDLPKRAVAAARGTHDPAFKDVPAFDNSPGGALPEYKARATGALVMGADDAGYGDIIKKSLGDRHIRTFKDANGYDIVEYKGDDGKPLKAYVNKPGLDMQDVGRGVIGSLPYMATGLGLGGLLTTSRAGGLVKSVTQGVGAGATSIATDVGSMALGSEQTPDVAKAGLNAAVAGAATAVAPIAGALQRRFLTVPSYVDSAGNLTPKGVAAAKAAGADPDLLQGDIAREFAKTYARSGNAEAAALQSQSAGLGVETTVGQRTKDAQQLLREKNMLYGVYGDNAKTVMENFYKRQADQIEKAVRGSSAGPRPQGDQSMIGMLAPGQPYISTNKGELGKNIQAGVLAARDVAKKDASEAWQQVKPMVPKPESFDSLGKAITDSLGDFRLHSGTPIANEMEGALAKFAQGQNVAAETKLIKQTPLQTTEDMRKHLSSLVKDAATPSDRTAARAIYDGYKNWTIDIAKKLQVEGDPMGAANALAAVDRTRELHEVFSLVGKNYKPNAASGIMKRVIEEETPERVVSALFSNPTKTDIKDGAIQALNALKKGLNKYPTGPANIDGRDTWNAIRVAHWSKLVQNAKGDLNTPEMMLNNIKSAYASHSSLVRTLYSEPEQMQIRRMEKMLDAVVAGDPNRSGSASAMGAMVKEFFGKLLDVLPAGARYAAEAAKVPQILRNATGNVQSRAAISQAIKTTTDPILAGPAAAGSNALYGQ